LAAILLFTGYKLSKPSLYNDMFRLGYSQFVPFVVTILAILLTDLLIGIGIGMAFGVYFILKAHYEAPFQYDKSTKEDGEHYIIRLGEIITFLNKANLMLMLERLPRDARVAIDGSRLTYIDYDVLEVIYNFQRDAGRKNIQIEMINIPPWQ